MLSPQGAPGRDERRVGEPTEPVPDGTGEDTRSPTVMDSRGIYDAMTRNVSSLHGLRSGRSGYELALAVAQSMETSLRWVNGDRQLADPLTKGGVAKKMMMQFLASGQWWTLVHDPMFVSGRNMRKKQLQDEMAKKFVEEVHSLAVRHRWPWPEVHDQRILGDAFSQDPCTPMVTYR